MAEVLFNIKIENTSLSTTPDASDATFQNYPTVKVEMENEFMSGEEAGTYDADNRMREVKVEKTDTSSEDVMTSSSQLVDTSLLKKAEDSGLRFDFVTRIKVEKELVREEESRSDNAENRMWENQTENIDVSSEDLTSSFDPTSVLSSSGQLVDCGMLLKEEDLGLYFEEGERPPEAGVDFRVPRASENDPICSSKGHSTIEADNIVKIHSSSREPSFSSFTDAEFAPNERNKSGNLQGDPSMHSSRRRFSCVYCTASFPRKYSLGQHMLVHSNEKAFACTQCLYKFKRKDDLQRHLKLKICSKKKFFDCSFCSARFETKEIRNQHLIVHLSEKPFMCAHCPARFSRKGNLKMHLVSHSGEKPFVCGKCPTRFAHKSNLKMHLALHSGEKPFSCAHCSAKYTRKLNLKKHLQIHSGEKQFICVHCPAMFATKGHLKQHLDIHSAKKLFICEHCPARFTMEKNLKRHLAIHAGKKPFGCSRCPARFFHKCDLKRHLASHLGEKPFVCAQCPARFTRRGALNKHLAAHSNEKLFICAQ